MLKFGSHFIPKEQIVYETEFSVVFVNIRPFLPFHLLVAPKESIPRLSELSFSQYSDLFSTVRILIKKIETLGSSFTVTVQDGPEAGQTVSHVHIHIIPRKKDDLKINNDIYEKTNLDVSKANRSEREMKEEAEYLKGFFK